MIGLILIFLLLLLFVIILIFVFIVRVNNMTNTWAIIIIIWKRKASISITFLPDSSRLFPCNLLNFFI
jgi:hypothetical protein